MQMQKAKKEMNCIARYLKYYKYKKSNFQM
jgi:hypothetical protein